MPSPARSSEMNWTAARLGPGDGAQRHTPAGDFDLAGGLRDEACERAQRVRRPRPHLAREANDRAALRIQREIVHRPGHGKMADTKQDLAALPPPVGVHLAASCGRASSP